MVLSRYVRREITSKITNSWEHSRNQNLIYHFVSNCSKVAVTGCLAGVVAALAVVWLGSKYEFKILPRFMVESCLGSPSLTHFLPRKVFVPFYFYESPIFFERVRRQSLPPSYVGIASSYIYGKCSMWNPFFTSQRVKCMLFTFLLTARRKWMPLPELFQTHQVVLKCRDSCL